MNKKLIVFCSLLCLLLLQGIVAPEQVIAADMEPLLVADFDSCSGVNNLGGEMGAAFQAPHNQLSEVYVAETGRGCKAKLEYQIRDWGAFWMKLPNPDLSQFRDNEGVLTFDIRADQPIPYGMQIELKRFCVPNEGCGELSVYFMTGITSEWQTRSVPVEGFGSTGWAPPLSSWESIEELVFTFAYPTAGNNGTVHLDNVRFENKPEQTSTIVPPTNIPSTPTAPPASQATCVGNSSAEFTAQAWLAMRDNNPEMALACTYETINLWTAEADVQQAQREQQDTCYVTPDPADQAAVDAFWASSWAVNDVAASWFIHGNALRQLGQIESARQAYQTVADHYSCGWAWDSAGWFWHIAQAARDQLAQLPN